MDIQSYIQRIFNCSSEEAFNELAIKAFRHQHENNTVYRSFCDLLNIGVGTVKTTTEIPFLPISLFKNRTVLCGEDHEQIFLSSGTSGMNPSKHYVKNLTLYEQSFLKGFELTYGHIEDYTILALLPSYLERNGSSLIYMVDMLIKKSGRPESGFFLNNWDELLKTLKQLEESGKKTLLIGVSFALLDMIEKYQLQLKNTIIIETGGMKGRKKEIVREDLHKLLQTGFGVNHIHSEYGMTELLSQAYSKKNGIFTPPPWMRVFAVDINDPFTILNPNKSGGLNIIDLANIHSCCFIATNDLTRVNKDGSFEILGRFDYSDLRGCNLLVN